jgi:hypothetical protein
MEAPEMRSWGKECDMTMILLETAVYVRPGFPVEFLIDVDGRAVRVAIEWSAIERMMGATPADVEQVRDFLHEHRSEIALAIKARLYARGIPLNGELVMERSDLDALSSVPPSRADRGSAASAGAGAEQRRVP